MSRGWRFRFATLYEDYAFSIHQIGLLVDYSWDNYYLNKNSHEGTSYDVTRMMHMIFHSGKSDPKSDSEAAQLNRGNWKSRNNKFLGKCAEKCHVVQENLVTSSKVCPQNKCMFLRHTAHSTNIIWFKERVFIWKWQEFWLLLAFAFKIKQSQDYFSCILH